MTCEGTAPGGLDLAVTALFRSSPTAAPPLRVGVVLPEHDASRWACLLLESLLATDYVTLLRVRSPGHSGGVARAAVFDAYEAASAARCADVDPLAPATPPRAFGALPAIDCEAPGTSPLLDVLLDLRSRAPPPACGRAALHGVWSVACGPEDAAPAGFAALESLAPLTTLELREHTIAEDSRLVTRVLAHAILATSPTPSAVANRLPPYWAGHHLALQALHTLHSRGAAALRHGAPAVAPTRPARPASTARFLRWCAREGARRAARRLRGAPSLTDWSVGLRRATAPLPEREPRDAFEGAVYLRNPPGRFLADPLLHEHRGRTWLFVEDYALDLRRGAISCGEVQADGSVAGFRPCLEATHHVSYPNVFVHDGETWLVPESERSGTVELYRALDFPHRWVRERTLLRLRCVDPTIVSHDGRWWLYATHVPLAGVDATLLLWHADSPLGPWRLHERRVIAVDARRGRAAGPPFVHAGRLMRPAQWSVPHYGRALGLHEVLRLSPTEYEERCVARFDAPAGLGLDGLHHYSRSGVWEAFDVRLQAPLARFEERPVRDADGGLAPRTLRGEVIPRR